MEKINDIRNRINNTKEKHTFWNFFKGIFLILTLILGFLIYARNDESATFVNQLFSTNISFTKMNSDIDLFISEMLAKLNIFSYEKDTDIKVNNNEIYISEGNNYYSTNSNIVYAIKKGKIVSINSYGEYYSVTIFYENEITACYYDLTSVLCKTNDLLYAYDNIGSYVGKFKVLFEKNDNILTYEEAIIS